MKPNANFRVIGQPISAVQRLNKLVKELAVSYCRPLQAFRVLVSRDSDSFKVQLWYDPCMRFDHHGNTHLVIEASFKNLNKTDASTKALLDLMASLAKDSFSGIIKEGGLAA